MHTLQTKNKRGFTLIESLVAISILVTVVVAATSAVQRGLSSYTFSKDEVIAFYLAQEGFEQIRNIRDENHLAGRDWLSGIATLSSDPCYFGNACTVSPVENQVATRCSAPGSCSLVRQDPALGWFGYNAAWNATAFRREITLTSISSVEVTMTVTVTWTKGGATRQFKAKENLLNWQ